MTVTSNENKLENAPSQDKVDVIPQQNQVDTKQQQKQPENKESEPPEDPNWRAFREARKKDRSEKEAAERKAVEKEAEIAALKAAMEAAFAKNIPVQNQSVSYGYDHEETDDEKIEKKVQAAISAREAAYEKQRLEREHQEYPQRLQQNFPDFNGTISQENLDYLDYHYPEVARPLQRLRDGYDKWSDIYLAIKKFVPNNTTAKKEAARADVNFSKPKSISSSSITQPGEAMSAARLSEERKAANWARMQNTLKGVG
jgi:hypothetical protein